MEKTAKNKLGVVQGGNAGQLSPTNMMQNMLKENHKKLVAVLGDNANSFMVSAINLYNNDLAGADPQSVMNGLFIAAALKLPIEKNLGFAYMIKYGNQAQFQLGYKGMIQLALRSGSVKKLNAIPITSGQLKSFNPLTEEIEFDLTKRGGEVEGYAAYMELVNGFNKTIYLTKQDIEEHADKFSQTYKADKKYNKNTSVWAKNFDEMALKTLIKKILKFAPLSTEMQMMEKVDQASLKKVDVEIDSNGKGNIITDSIEAEYIDNEKNNTPVSKEDIIDLLGDAHNVKVDIKKKSSELKIDFDNMNYDDFMILRNFVDSEIDKSMEN